MVDRQQVVAVVQHDGPVAHHHALALVQHEGIGPCHGVVARDLGLDAGGGPRRAVADDVEEPHHAVGRLPDHAVAERSERVARDDLRRRPRGGALRRAAIRTRPCRARTRPGRRSRPGTNRRCPVPSGRRGVCTARSPPPDRTHAPRQAPGRRPAPGRARRQPGRWPATGARPRGWSIMLSIWTTKVQAWRSPEDSDCVGRGSSVGVAVGLMLATAASDVAITRTAARTCIARLPSRHRRRRFRVGHSRTPSATLTSMRRWPAKHTTPPGQQWVANRGLVSVKRVLA